MFVFFEGGGGEGRRVEKARGIGLLGCPGVVEVFPMSPLEKFRVQQY